MSTRTTTARSLLTLGLLATLAAAPTAARASAAKAPPDVRLGAKWVVRLGDAELGVETFKLVAKADGRSFASGKFRPDAEDAAPYVYMLWRGAEGRLTKYQRLEDRRLGPGVKAFRRGDTLRIVGLKDKKRPPAELPATGRVVWDVKLFGTFWDWLPKLKTAAAEVSLSVLDVDASAERVARCVRQPTVTLTNRKGAAAEITPWTVAGLGVQGLTLYLDARGRLVGARAGQRTVLLDGWRWTPPPVEPPDAGSTDAADAAGAPNAASDGGDRGQDAGPTAPAKLPAKAPEDTP